MTRFLLCTADCTNEQLFQFDTDLNFSDFVDKFDETRDNNNFDEEKEVLMEMQEQKIISHLREIDIWSYNNSMKFC